MVTLRSGSKTGADDLVRQEVLQSLGLPSDYDFLSPAKQRLLQTERDAKAEAYVHAVFAAQRETNAAIQAQLTANTLAASGAGPSTTPAGATQIDLTSPGGTPKQLLF